MQFHDDLKNADTDVEAEPGSSPKQEPIAGLLEKQIAAPLTRVQTALAKETVVWKRGILVTPKVSFSSLRPALPEESY